MNTTENTAHALNACSTDHSHMHMEASVKGADVLSSLNRLNLVSFTPEELIDAVRLEIWCSTFSNPSEKDYNSYELYDADNNLIANRMTDNY